MLAAQHHINDNGGTPYIDLQVVWLFAEDLGRDVVFCAHAAVQFALGVANGGEPEVHEPDMHGLVPTPPIRLLYKDVFEFDVTVDDVLRVHVVQGAE